MTEIFTYQNDSPILFTSGTFWLLFIGFILLYSLIYNRKWQMLMFVTAFSFFFYYKSSGLFCFMLFGTSMADWLISKQIQKSTVIRHRKLWVALSLIMSLGLLAYFKYANFFAMNWSEIVGSNFQPIDIFLPVGISFYTFQSVSYIVDVYKRRVKPTRTWLEYGFYLSFFPQLVAGPIVRADLFLPQINRPKLVTRQTIYAGLWLVIVGIFKKAVIADYISQYNDLIFDSPTAYSGFETAMGVLGYTAQIYCDFSGYSDMAIGIGAIMGYNLGVNFLMPYQSLNVTEFWRRWHISLSSWLRDYIYIPLGGNRKGRVRTYINLFLTMLIGGFWHGAAWKFVFWGGMHGAGLMVHKALKHRLDRLPNNIPVTILSWIFTFVFVSLLWVFFRAADFTASCRIIGHMFSDFSLDYIVPFVTTRWSWCVMIAIVFALHTMKSTATARLSELFVASPWVVKLIIFVIVVQMVIQFGSEEVQPFIYFQF